MESHGKRRKLSISYLTLIMALTIVSGSVIVFASPGVLTNEPESASASTLDEKSLLSENRNAAKGAMQVAQEDSSELQTREDSEVTPAKPPFPKREDEAVVVKTPESSKQGIFADQAIAIALANANLTAEQVKSLKVKNEGNGKIYDVEFTANGIEYDYEIDAKSGTILKLDQESKGGNASGPKLNEKKEQNPNGEKANAPSKDSKSENMNKGGTENNGSQSGVNTDANDKKDYDKDPDDKDEDVDHDIEEHDDNDSDHDND